MTETTKPWCAGGCGRTMLAGTEDAWCASCWPSGDPMPRVFQYGPKPHVLPSSIRQVRFDLLNAAHRLAFGSGLEKKQALEELSHLIVVLQHEKETQA